MENVYIKGMSYELGEPFDIGGLQELRADPAKLDELTRGGLARYARSSQPPAGLAQASAARTLWKARVPPGDVDAVVYATTSFARDEYHKKDINDLLIKLQLTRAYPVGVTLSECGNLIAALRVARALVGGEGCRNVLVIVTDRVEESESRLVPPGVSVASDAAASFMVSGRERAQFEVLAVETHILPTPYTVHPSEDFGVYLKVVAQGLGEITRRTLAAVDRKPGDFRQLLTNNFNSAVSRIVCMQTGFDAGQLYDANIARYGHGFGADPVINLQDHLMAEPAAEGDLFFLLATGPMMWGSAVLKRV